MHTQNMNKANGTPLLASEGYYLTDGGLETTLVFHKGIDLPHFAAFELLMHGQGRKTLRDYYFSYLDLARSYGTGFILEAPTWRANRDWGFKLGYTDADLVTINRQAIQFMRELKSSAGVDQEKVLISGCIGPRGDGYSREKLMTAEEAEEYHRPQIQAFADENADLASAMTLTYSSEALGIVLAAREAGLPVVISFTLETDGKLPGGERLKEAIQIVEQKSDCYPAYYMINCAHPEHFADVLSEPGEWKQRIGAVRANASTRSHAELDESETLDTGDKARLAEGYLRLKELLPELRIVGGCCGTDHTHLEEICEELMAG